MVTDLDNTKPPQLSHHFFPSQKVWWFYHYISHVNILVASSGTAEEGTEEGTTWRCRCLAGGRRSGWGHCPCGGDGVGAGRVCFCRGAPQKKMRCNYDFVVLGSFPFWKVFVLAELLGEDEGKFLLFFQDLEEKGWIRIQTIFSL